MTPAENLICSSVLIVVIVLLIAQTVYNYKENKSKLNIHTGAIKIQPSKARFFIAWLVYAVCQIFPWLLVLWIFPFDRENGIGLVVFAIILLLLAIPMYPYYTIVTYGHNMEGATLWGWRLKREEMAISEIDKEKTLRRNIGRKLGIVIFYALDGKKILSLGLNDFQVNQILESSAKSDEPI